MKAGNPRALDGSNGSLEWESCTLSKAGACRGRGQLGSIMVPCMWTSVGKGIAPSTIQGSTRFDRWEPGRENQGKRGSKPSRQAPPGPGFTGLPEMPDCLSTKSRALRGVYSDLISLLPCFPTLRPWHFRANSHSPHVTKNSIRNPCSQPELG